MEKYLISTNRVPFAFDISNYTKEVIIDFENNFLITNHFVEEEVEGEKVKKQVDVKVEFEELPKSFWQYIVKPKLLEAILLLIAVIIVSINLFSNITNLSLLGTILVSFVISFIIYLGYLVLLSYSFVVKFVFYILFLLSLAYAFFGLGLYKVVPVFLQVFIITVTTLHLLSQHENLYALKDHDGLYFSVIKKVENEDNENKEEKEVEEN